VFDQFYPVGGFYSSEPTLLIYSIMEELNTNGPVSVCFHVYESFFNIFKTNPTGVYSQDAINAYIAANGADTLEGGHAVTLVG